jgi:hypothetical protein
MTIRGFGAPERQLFCGDLLLIACCVFYLAWWLLAFRPARPVRGMRSGWLLLPASAAGLGAVVLILRGVFAVPAGASPFPAGSLLWGGAAAYVLLLAATRLIFRRPVTTELFLIVGWAALVLAETGALRGLGRLPRGAETAFFAAVGLVTAADLVCYTLYYRLDARAGYFDGMFPLASAIPVMAALAAAAVR